MTIGTPSMLISNRSSDASSSTSSNSTASDNGIDAKNFMTLLVAEIQNQDPTQPMDPTTFMSQLVQLNELQQVTQINQVVQQFNTSSVPQKG